MNRGLPNVSTRVSAAVAVAAAVEALDRENHSDAALARADDTYLWRAREAHCTHNKDMSSTRHQEGAENSQSGKARHTSGIVRPVHTGRQMQVNQHERSRVVGETYTSRRARRLSGSGSSSTSFGNRI